MEDTPQQSPPKLTALLEQFKDIFQEPTELPPEREVDHQIPLQPDATIVKSSPYRMSFSQKDTMESLIL
jgi:hypothetical protein